MLKFQGLVGPYLKVTRFSHKESHALRYLKTFIAIKSFFGCIKITDSKTPLSFCKCNSIPTDEVNTTFVGGLKDNIEE